MFEGLKSLLHAGPAAAAPKPEPAPAPKPVATVPAPEPVVAPSTEAESVARLHEDWYSDLKRYSDPNDHLVVAGGPAAVEVIAVPETPLTPEQLDAAMAEAIPTTPQIDPLTHEVWNRPVDPEEEKREDLEARSGKRIEFLLATYERGRRDLTEARILNDKLRHRNLNPVPTYSPYKKVDTNPQSYILKA